LEKTGDVLGIPLGRIEGDLQRFQDYLEERGNATGGWRGEIHEVEIADAGYRPTAGSRAEEVNTEPYAAEHQVSQTTADRTSRPAGVDTVEVPLSEEEVKVGKRTVDAGEVKLHKTVTTEHVNVPVELKHEDVVVERVATHEVGKKRNGAFPGRANQGSLKSRRARR
jgi:hypothetical protein